VVRPNSLSTVDSAARLLLGVVVAAGHRVLSAISSVSASGAWS
jgi:hypothetical protein